MANSHKRRRSLSQGPSTRSGSDATIQQSGHAPSTPRKVKKKVRFSDPGPEIEPSSTASTGLTPFVARCSVRGGYLSEAPRRRSTPLGRRHSFSNLVDVDKRGRTEVVQFSSLVQALDPRTRRRLHRRNLSEEMNNIEEEKKHLRRTLRFENDTLRKELAEQSEEIDRLKSACNVAEAADTEELISNEQFAQDDDAGPMDQGFESTMNLPPTPSSGPRTRSVESPISPAESNGNDNELDFRASIQSLQTPPETPKTPRYKHASTTTEDRADADAEKKALQESVATHMSTIERLKGTLEYAAQSHYRLLTKLESHVPRAQDGEALDGTAMLDEALDQILTSLALAESKVEDAEVAIRGINSEIGELGFPGNNAYETIQSLKAQFRSTRLEFEYISPGENATGFDNSKLFEMLLNRIKILMKNIADRDELLETQRTRDGIMYEQLHAKEKLMDKLNSRIFNTERDLNEKESSISKLQKALNSYRKEVKGLEALVSKLEHDHVIVTERSRMETDEAVADLDCRLQVEILLRGKAEESDARSQDTIKDLEGKWNSAKNFAEAIQFETQALIRQKESELESLRAEVTKREAQHGSNLASRDARILSLRKETEDLNDALGEARHTIARLMAEKASLESKGTHAATDIIEQLEKDLRRVVKKAHTRFSTSEGGDGNDDPVVLVEDSFVRPRIRFSTETSEEEPSKKRSRRKRKADSGIGILDEDDIMQD